MSFFTKYKDVLLILISAVLYFVFAYFLERTEFKTLLFLWYSLFGCFYLLINSKTINTSTLIALVLFFRILFLFAIPNLSQDFYRFIWDGRMILEGINPYLSFPKTYIKQSIQPIHDAYHLYSGMGELNGSHYTNYPPINQLCFFFAALFAGKSIFGSIIVLKVIIISADMGILYFGTKLLKRLHLPIRNIFWYALNPFIIIEMTGNLHFEPVMIFFLIWSLYTLYKQQWILAAILLACSISVKLIPLLMLPLFYQWFVRKDQNWITSFKKLSLFYTIVLSTTFLLFLPFYTPEFLKNYSSSISLWFQNFEFNGSFYYIFRKIGYYFSGYNEIALIGKITPLLTFIFLMIITFVRKNNTMIAFITVSLFGLCFYYFTASTVHPWYLATPLFLSIFTKYRFPIIWTIVVIFSYQAYVNVPSKENLWWISVEYSILYGFLLFELRKTSIKIKL
ncbi:MAG: mannosyltransferase [Polaribacter sp.]|nr:mannosyltransferase [Polaribacter sp.]